MSKNSNKKVIIIAVIMIVMGLIFSLSKSYAYFETSIAGSNVTMGVGRLIHSLNSDVKLQNGEKKQIDLIVKSNDDIASKYQVYYKSRNDLTGVSVGYSQDSTDLPSGEIEGKGVRNITIVLENNSSNEVSIEIGVRGGLVNNSVEDIVLEEGENRIVNVLESVSDDGEVCVNNNRNIQKLENIDITTPGTLTLEFTDLDNIVGLSFYEKKSASFGRVSQFSISSNSMTLKYVNNIGTYSGTVSATGVEYTGNATLVSKTGTNIIPCKGYGYGYGLVEFNELSEVIAITSFSQTGVASGYGDIGYFHIYDNNKVFVIYDNSGYSNGIDMTVTFNVVGIE